MTTANVTRLKKLPVYGSAADERFGYAFGIEGTLSVTDACKFLANIHRATLDRLAEAGKIRKRRMGGRAVFCSRSLREYLASLGE